MTPDRWAAMSPSLLAALLLALAVLVRPGRPRGGGRPAGRADPGGPARPGVAVGGSDAPGGRLSVDDLAEAMVLVALALRGGAPVSAALTHVAAVLDGPAGADLARVAEALRTGLPPGAAWRAAGRAWTPMASALSLASRAGIPASDALMEAADDLWRDLAGRREAAAGRAGVLLVLPLGLAYLPAFVLTTIVPVVVGIVLGLGRAG